MSYHDRPFQDSQDATFMGLEPHNPWHAFSAAPVPDAAMVFSAEFAPLPSEASWSHDAPSFSGGTALTATPSQHAGALGQPASLMDWDPWVEPPAAPCSASASHALPHIPIMPGANGPAPDAPHASVSHNTPTNTSKPPNMMPGCPPKPNGDRSTQASTASSTSEHRNLELAMRQICASLQPSLGRMPKQPLMLMNMLVHHATPPL